MKCPNADHMMAQIIAYDKQQPLIRERGYFLETRNDMEIQSEQLSELLLWLRTTKARTARPYMYQYDWNAPEIEDPDSYQYTQDLLEDNRVSVINISLAVYLSNPGLVNQVALRQVPIPPQSEMGPYLYLVKDAIILPLRIGGSGLVTNKYSKDTFGELTVGSLYTIPAGRTCVLPNNMDFLWWQATARS